MNYYTILFLVVFLLNVIPAFAPPTWIVFSFLGLRFPEHMGWGFALTGALAATLGRCVLARASDRIVRGRWMSERTRENVDSVRRELEHRPKLTFGVFLFYAFTPLPSNFVFIAYGLTRLPIPRLAVPFFLGRFTSYSFWTFGTAAVGKRLNFEELETLGYFGIYFVTTQLVLLGILYAFARFDWKALLRERKCRWLGPVRATPKGGV